MAKTWGQTQTQYLRSLQGKRVTIAFLDGKGIQGELTGVDTYDIFVRTNDKEVMISKGSIRYIHEAKSEGQQ